MDPQADDTARARALVFTTRRPSVRYALGAAAAASGVEFVEADSAFLDIALDGRAGAVVVVDTVEEPELADCIVAARAAGAAVVATLGEPGMLVEGANSHLPFPAGQDYLTARIRGWVEGRDPAWQPAMLPPDEGERLGALHDLGILDTPPEERFDRLTRLAAERLGVPIALVSLVDADRQWFKSRFGLDAEETPRDMAFCAHAILDEEILLVPDAQKDPRFAGNPLVEGQPRVRFYAGAPLTLADGRRVGTLCAIDHVPREVDQEQLESLKELAGLVEEELQRES